MKDGRVYGNSGCNRLMGVLDVAAKPGEIDLGQLGSTRMMCPDMTLERNVLSALSQVKKYRKLDDGTLALCASSKRPSWYCNGEKLTQRLSLSISMGVGI